MSRVKVAQIATAKSGQNILRLKGKYLSSPSDPEREAVRWYDRNRELMDAKSIIILGAGSGYHLLKIVENHPRTKIVVIDPFREVVELVKTIHRHIFMLGIEFESVSNLTDLTQLKSIQEAVSDSYSVIDYNLNVYCDRFLNFRLLDFLNARTEDGLIFVGNIRGYFDKSTDYLLPEDQIEEASELISINNISDMGLDLFSDEDLSWKQKILEKLVVK